MAPLLLDPSYAVPEGLERASILSILEKAAAGTEAGYASLYVRANKDAGSLQDLVPSPHRPCSRPIFLLYFGTHAENIRWFWASIVAGAIPCVAAPFMNDPERRVEHIAHLRAALDNPVVLTTQSRLAVFLENKDVNVRTVDSLPTHSRPPLLVPKQPMGDDVAVLTLTSGSTSNAKPICLSSSQILHACFGKKAHSKTVSDHVVNLVEMHLHAMCLGAEQVQVEADDLLNNPLLFPRLVHRHGVTVSFAPNFFLDLLQARMKANDPNLENPEKLDVSTLRSLFSGGEANVVETAVRLTRAFRAYGAKSEFLCPGYGLSETCAGVFWGFQCPSKDVKHGREFTSVGRSIPGCHFRVVDAEGKPVPADCPGELQLSGPVVFKKYHNNPEATAAAFTPDGWFRTGDVARTDAAAADGRLSIVGRLRDTININGVKYFCSEVESAIEQARLPGVEPTFTAAFAHRAPGARTEGYVVVYRPSASADSNRNRNRNRNCDRSNDDDDDDVGAARATVADHVTRLAGGVTNARPLAVVALPPSAFAKSSLGKLSRARLAAAYEAGAFAGAERRDVEAIRVHRERSREPPATAAEREALDVVCGLLPGLRAAETSVAANIFALGLTSLDFFALARRLGDRLSAMKKNGGGDGGGRRRSRAPPALVDILRQPTVRGISGLLQLSESEEDGEGEGEGEGDDMVVDGVSSPSPDELYDPVVTLQPHGDKVPLWLVHPASGNVLAFVPLARHLSPDRPVHGLRATGVRPGERFFGSVGEMAGVYLAAVKRTQPCGPYAVAGYSLGSTLAFELARRLLAAGDEVRFVGALDSPPHIAGLVGGLTWSACLVMVGFFLGLLPDERRSNELVPRLWHADRCEALDLVLARADPARLAALGLDRAGLAQVADVADSFGRAARDYVPEGHVEHLDVFVVDPLLSITEAGRQDWVDRFLSRWKDFVREGVEFHQCEGSHADMLSLKYVRSFQRILKAALAARGI
ncbi:acetyl-CoA synthetase-like protein [Xylariaceae sp. FL0804]|nr:acetyl-CoA synthetase-like protein [Xylariaceae sp. FL0804]